MIKIVDFRFSGDNLRRRKQSGNVTFSLCHIVQVSALSLRTSVLGIQERPLTVCSNSAVAVVVGSGQEALGLFICQDTSTRGEPLEEIPAEEMHKSVQQASKADAALARNTGVPWP